jgi:hypothetical protein
MTKEWGRESPPHVVPYKQPVSPALSPLVAHGAREKSRFKQAWWRWFFRSAKG